LVEPDRYSVRCQVRVVVVVGQLETGDHDQAVVGEGAVGFGADGSGVRWPGPDVDGVWRGVFEPDGVVGDAEDIDARLTVQVDELRQGQIPVAPGGVRVQLANKQVAHPSECCQDGHEAGGEVETIRSRTGDGRT
jgi:hypothetical protein